MRQFILRVANKCSKEIVAAISVPARAACEQILLVLSEEQGCHMLVFGSTGLSEPERLSTLTAIATTSSVDLLSHMAGALLDLDVFVGAVNHTLERLVCARETRICMCLRACYHLLIRSRKIF